MSRFDDGAVPVVILFQLRSVAEKGNTKGIESERRKKEKKKDQRA